MERGAQKALVINYSALHSHLEPVPFAACVLS